MTLVLPLQPSLIMQQLSDTTNDEAIVRSTLQLYLDGLYEGDLGKLQTAFHEDGALHTISNGTLIIEPVQNWFTRFEHRQSPQKSKDEQRVERVVSIEFASPSIAFAKLECLVLQTMYVDYMTLGKLNDGWRIITKTHSIVRDS